MAILWRESMSVGNDSIDRDHRYLICLINTVELAMQSDGEDELLSLALKQLKEYTSEHFTREEKLQKKISYPDYVDHMRKHNDLINQLNRISRDLMKKMKISKTIDNQGDIIELLRYWLLDHVLQDDLEMKPFLAKYPCNLV